jgi:hypothetical protein
MENAAPSPTKPLEEILGARGFSPFDPGDPFEQFALFDGIQRNELHGHRGPALRASGGHANTLIEELRREVGSVGPHDRVKLGVKDESSEVRRLAERLEYGTIEITSQIDLALGTIAEPEPHNEISHIPHFQQPWHVYSSGAKGRKGCLARARSQFSSNSARCACLHSCTFPRARRGKLPQRTAPSRMLTATSCSPQLAWK